MGMTDKFTFFKSFYEATEDFDKDELWEFYHALCGCVFRGEAVADGCSKLTKSVIKAILPNIGASIRFNEKQAENGQKGGRPKTQDETGETQKTQKNSGKTQKNSGLTQKNSGLTKKNSGLTQKNSGLTHSETGKTHPGDMENPLQNWENPPADPENPNMEMEMEV